MSSDGSLSGSDRRLVKLLNRLLGERSATPSPRLLLATDRDDSPFNLPHGADVLRLPQDHHDVQAFLTAHDPWDLVVVDVDDTTVRRAAFLRLAFAPEDTGHIVVARVRKDVTSPAQSVLRTVTSVLGHLPGDPAPAGIHRRALGHLASAWHKVELDGPHLVVSSATDARVKLDEHDVDQLLATQPHRGSVITRLPGATFSPLGSKQESDSPLAGSWREQYDVPTLSLREYSDVTALPGQLLFQDRVILPDSFRHIGKANPGNRFAPNLGPSFVQGPGAEPTRVLDQPHFYWDSEYRGHYGHLMTEMLSRMWAFEEARQRHPDLKVFMAHNKSRGLATFEVTVLEAFGGTRDDITFVDEPVRLNTMLAATPMFSQPHYVHPEIVGVWDRLSAHLAAQAPERERPRRVFVGRKTGKRACTNGAEVEALFTARGFEVVFPEEHSLPEQARLFREADVLAGYAGSGLFNAMLCTTPKHMVLISSESYTAENEWMIAAARGHHVDVVWCEAEIPMKKGSFNKQAFHSSFTFNPEREGVFLRRVLDQLG